MDSLKRRQLLIALGAGPCLISIAAAQSQYKVWRIGFLAQRHIDFIDTDVIYAPLMQGLRQHGYFEGKNLLIEWRFAEGNVSRLPELAMELVRLKPDILVTHSTPGGLALQKATSTIPVVVIAIADPVGSGLVRSLARPGANITALTSISSELNSKRLELLRSMVPKMTRAAVLVNPTNIANMAGLKAIQDAAANMSIKLQPFEVTTPADITNAFSIMNRQNIDALVVTLEPFLQQQRSQIVELALKQRLPCIGAYGQFTEDGGLMSYGQSLRESFRRAGTYIDKIFKGTNPGDIPVEQPTQFELVINIKTATLLGIKVPQSILVQATKLIE